MVGELAEKVNSSSQYWPPGRRVTAEDRWVCGGMAQCLSPQANALTSYKLRGCVKPPEKITINWC